MDGVPQAWGMGGRVIKTQVVSEETTALLPLNPGCYEPEHKDQANETCYADEDASGRLTLHNGNSLSNGTRRLLPEWEKVNGKRVGPETEWVEKRISPLRCSR
jgi:hypothetical protein